jgi:predicted Rossmann-fold nucleotide-binding protein
MVAAAVRSGATGAVVTPGNATAALPHSTVCEPACSTGRARVRRRPTSRAAEEFGTALATARIGVVYGGAQVGLMGAVADATLAAGGEVVGVIPDALDLLTAPPPPPVHKWIDLEDV